MNAVAVEQAAHLFRSGKLNEAAECFTAILAQDPQNFDALHGLGLVHSRRGEFETAERLFDVALAQRPSSPEVLFNRASLLQKCGRYAEALACFDAALAVRAGFAEVFANRGAVLMDLGRYQDALADFTALTNAKPSLTQGWLNRGAALVKLARYRDAYGSYSNAIGISPELVEPRLSRAWVSLVLRQYAEALSDTAWILDRRPDNAPAWRLRGDILAQTSRREMAVESYGRAIALQPNDEDALNNRAINLFALLRFEEAAVDWAALVEFNPDYRYALGNLFFARRCCCDWPGSEKLLAKLGPKLSAGKLVAQPFHTFICCTTAEEIFAPSRGFASSEYPPKVPLASGVAYSHDRIRIGYLSGNFHNHAVARLIAGVFEHHDRARFDVQAFSFGPDDGGSLRRRLAPQFDAFIDVRHWDDDRAAQEIRSREIDVLVDLMGFTENSRPGIVAHRPAPVQINYLGFPGTMAADYVDYLVADAVVIPERHASCYSEKIIRLPHCYLPADDRRPVGQSPSRKDAGLPERGFVFCCFNHSYKITPDIFAVWMRLLRAVPSGWLWLSNLDPTAKRNILAEAQARNVDTARIIFAPFAGEDADHLARLSVADLFLDTNGYNAHATASDALWAGVPVLTICGDTFPARVGASLLRSIGLDELIAPDLGTYQQIALSLAADRSRLSDIRTKLARNRATHPLFNTRIFTRNLESAYATVVDRSRKGLTPRSFAAGSAA